MIQNSFVKKGIVVGIIVVALIIIGLVSYFSDNQNNNDLLSESDIPAESTPTTGTHFSINLTESMTMRNVP